MKKNVKVNCVYQDNIFDPSNMTNLDMIDLFETRKSTQLMEQRMFLLNLKITIVYYLSSIFCFY